MDEWDPDEKEKNITQDREIKVNGGTTKCNKNKGGSSAFLGQTQTYYYHARSSIRSRGSVFQILAPLNLKEPWYLVVLASGRRSKSLWRVIWMEFARVAEFIK